MKKIPICNKKGEIIDFTLVDNKDYNKLSQFKWFIGKWYPVCFSWDGKKKKMFYMHRIITDCPKGLEVDHINENKLDNRRINLRVCTHKENNVYRGINQRKRKNP